jgi:hypothetical protein
MMQIAMQTTAILAIVCQSGHQDIEIYLQSSLKIYHLLSAPITDSILVVAFIVKDLTISFIVRLCHIIII